MKARGPFCIRHAAADTFAMVVFCFVTGMIIEIFVSGMTFQQSLASRTFPFPLISRLLGRMVCLEIMFFAKGAKFPQPVG